MTGSPELRTPRGRVLTESPKTDDIWHFACDALHAQVGRSIDKTRWFISVAGDSLGYFDDRASALTALDARLDEIASALAPEPGMADEAEAKRIVESWQDEEDEGAPFGYEIGEDEEAGCIESIAAALSRVRSEREKHQVEAEVLGMAKERAAWCSAIDFISGQVLVRDKFVRLIEWNDARREAEKLPLRSGGGGTNG